jgi:tRNA-2-methylthio-N6-dimethylallyladenosine synthase
VYLPPIKEVAVTLAATHRLARLYVPIQSGSERVLKLMRRQCDLDRVKNILKCIRAAVPAGRNLTIGTSIIVGFPSETLEELQMTIDLCKEVHFDWIWCHSYSARPETAAASMGMQIGADEILRRARTAKVHLKAQSLVTTAEDQAGSRTCQG